MEIEFLDDSLGHDRIDALDETGAQIFLDPIDRGRHRGFVLNYLELLTVFGMIGPFPSNFCNFAGDWCHQISNNCHQVPLPVHLQFGDGVRVFLVGVCDSFYLALEIGECICWLVSHHPTAFEDE